MNNNTTLSVINAVDIVHSLEENGIILDDNQQCEIETKICEVLNYIPKIGVLGKTGVGKSSLCNALFGADVCPINDIEACTREPQEIKINLADNNGITLIDVPGAGESLDRDKEYSEMYARLLPTLDVILWVIKSDDRALAADEHFYINVIKPHIAQGKPFFFVLNQVDKTEPFRKWNYDEHKPCVEQNTTIARKIQSIADFFHVSPASIIPVSALEKYNLSTLVYEMICAVPAEKKITVYRNINKEFHSESLEQHIIDSTTDFFAGFIGIVANIAINNISRIIGIAIGNIFTKIKNIFGWL